MPRLWTARRKQLGDCWRPSPRPAALLEQSQADVRFAFAFSKRDILTWPSFWYSSLISINPTGKRCSYEEGGTDIKRSWHPLTERKWPWLHETRVSNPSLWSGVLTFGEGASGHSHDTKWSRAQKSMAFQTLISAGSWACVRAPWPNEPTLCVTRASCCQRRHYHNNHISGSVMLFWSDIMAGISQRLEKSGRATHPLWGRLAVARLTSTELEGVLHLLPPPKSSGNWLKF